MMKKHPRATYNTFPHSPKPNQRIKIGMRANTGMGFIKRINGFTIAKKTRLQPMPRATAIPTIDPIANPAIALRLVAII
jgi:hypothetical protein